MSASTRNLRQLGARAEAQVRSYLERAGWRILAANFRCPAGEIDLIAEEPTAEGFSLVFLEVKARQGASHGAPFEAVDARKQRRLIASAQHYLMERSAGGIEPNCRFDVAEVWIEPESGFRIVLHRAAFWLQ